MRRKISVIVPFIVFLSMNLFAADGDLIVNGNVGIGTSPSYKLDVNGVTKFGSYVFLNGTNYTCSTALHLNYTGGVNQYGIEFIPSIDSTFPLWFLNAGGTVVGYVATYSDHTLYGSASDGRLKENIVSTILGLDTLLKITVRDYTFIADPQKKKYQGLIAQELQQIYPYAVAIGGDDPKKNPWGIDYGRMTPLIIAAVQDLAKKQENAQAKSIPKGMIGFFPGSCPTDWIENPRLTGTLEISGNPVNVTACQAP